MWWDGVATVGLAVMLCLGAKLVFVVAGAGSKDAPIEGTFAIGVAIISCMAFEVLMHMVFCAHAVWEKNWLWANSFFTADGQWTKDGVEFEKALKAVAISASLLCSSLFLSLIPGPVPLHARQTAQVAAVWRGSDVNIKRGRGGPRASLLPPLKPSDINALTTCRSHRTRTLKDRALWCNG
ncbi:hypothetical protein GGTG_14426 [Gaeumannomyces tritici R3-111a-1]|uniref:Uncharacterized protein n=1 Tax=Gaeumannomyces tritici (strain R3-111a-1) TaxID=644352 RepID=J3PLF7_GAET3|nr:hypothetical protein GGTG_14426 [Gaeumannomyces tritici R3-111a-1]EJT67997.1 hypothetical protein GGTG_14426 [Gaeumannomyces tritici R3-111a-1]